MNNKRIWSETVAYRFGGAESISEGMDTQAGAARVLNTLASGSLAKTFN